MEANTKMRVTKDGKIKLNESELRDQILDFLQWIPNSSFRKKLGTLGQKTWLDVIGCMDGQYVEFEIKTPHNTRKIPKHQLDRIAELERCNAVTGIVRSVKDVKELLGVEGMEIK